MPWPGQERTKRGFRTQTTIKGITYDYLGQDPTAGQNPDLLDRAAAHRAKLILEGKFPGIKKK